MSAGGVGRMWVADGAWWCCEEVALGNGMTAAEFIDKMAEGHADGRRPSRSRISMICARCWASGRRWKLIRRGRRTALSGGRRRTAAVMDWRMFGSGGILPGSTSPQGKDLDAAFQQLRQYALAAGEPAAADRLGHAATFGFIRTGRTASARSTSSRSTTSTTPIPATSSSGRSASRNGCGLSRRGRR